jgi:hypothetical protein
MNQCQVRPRQVPLLCCSLGLTLLTGCSLLYDFGTHQCSTTDDCLKMGPAFADSVCKSEVCVRVAAQAGAPTAGAGGSSETGGGAAGSAGASEQAVCSNEQCMKDHGSPTFICRNNACVDLSTADCPVLIPKDSVARLLKKPDVIVIGGFAAMANKANPYDSQAIANWDLAFAEFNQASFDGLPGYGGGGQRPLVGLVCNGASITDDALNASMKHLTDTVQVPAILSTLTADSLYHAWQYLNPDGVANLARSVFFMSTGSANLQLANLADDGLMWHILGDPRTLAAPVVAFLKLLEPVVNAERAANFALTGVDDPTTTPLRVTLISSDEPIMVDIANVLTRTDSDHPGMTLAFNGLPLSANSDAGNFRWASIQSARLYEAPDVTAGIKELTDNPPHVIVAMATKEFAATVLPNVENTWSTAAKGMIRPYYVMSHLIYNTPELESAAKNFSSMSPPLTSRVVGVNYASAQEARAKALYGDYLLRLRKSYQGTLSIEGTENHYDGAYYLLYSLVAAAASLNSPSGSDIAYGLKTRIISESTSAVSVDVGPDPLSGSGTGSGTIARLFGDKVSYRISLYGTLGPPNFDFLSGTRNSATSAWCLQQDSGTTWSWKTDGLMFDLASRTFIPGGDAIPSCLQQYCTSLDTGGTPSCVAESH